MWLWESATRTPRRRFWIFLVPTIALTFLTLVGAAVHVAIEISKLQRQIAAASD